MPYSITQIDSGISGTLVRGESSVALSSLSLPYTLENGDVINITAAPAGSTVNGNAITDGGTFQIINSNLVLLAGSGSAVTYSTAYALTFNDSPVITLEALAAFKTKCDVKYQPKGGGGGEGLTVIQLTGTSGTLTSEQLELITTSPQNVALSRSSDIFYYSLDKPSSAPNNITWRYVIGIGDSEQELQSVNNYTITVDITTGEWNYSERAYTVSSSGGGTQLYRHVVRVVLNYVATGGKDELLELLISFINSSSTPITTKQQLLKNVNLFLYTVQMANDGHGDFSIKGNIFPADYPNPPSNFDDLYFISSPDLGIDFSNIAEGPFDDIVTPL